jgi:phenylalanyl-tRNA synthetase alpha chain
MKTQIEALKQQFLADLPAVTNQADLENFEQKYLGKKGQLAELSKGLKDVDSAERPKIGQLINEVRYFIETSFSELSMKVEAASAQEKIEKEWIDITAPGINSESGHLHLVTQAIDEITSIFAEIGFSRQRHPEIDWDWYAFESLNIPKGHPARDEWETFFVGDSESIAEGEMGKIVLTPHTSNAQVRQMQVQKPPIRMISINKTYRRQSGIRHSPMFHQFEGLFIDENVNLAELKGVVEYFAKRYFGEDRRIRLRPHHFRFTEPSFEIDITAESGREGEKLFKDGWLELGGAGMVHPNVIKSAGLDPEKYTGFAFGWGVERTLMMKSGISIPDIRLLYKNDLRFLKQF